MEKESKSAGGGLSSSGIIAVVMLTAGVLFIREVPLETTRLPVTEPRIQQSSTMQDVDARLWQEPLGAIARSREDAAKRNAEQAKGGRRRHTARALRDDIHGRMEASGRKAEVSAVMLPGGPYSDDIESRRRTRYAVLAGLSASRLAPADSDHLGYFFPTGVDTPSSSLPEIVPYEWFEPAIDGPPRKGDATQPLVLVMWIDGDIFSGTPLARMRDLIARFDPLNVGWRVLGPSGSDQLRDMVDELQQQGAGKPLEKSLAGLPLRFYSASATAPDERIFTSPPEQRTRLTLSDYLEARNVQLVRTIGNDSDLADAMIQELKTRGLKAHTVSGDYFQACDWTQGDNETVSHIAVIAEWDTLYGRTLRREFRATPFDEGFCAHRFTYVRGIDGQMPAGNADGASSKSSPAKSGGDAKEDNRRRDGTFVEIAEGQSQFDYLRRLSVRMRELDRQLRESSADGKGLRAIGVLGSDVHDKLLVLQALQPEFPNAMFFTTDLDARFLHPRERAWTRNLIVGSNFGLRLNDRLQAGVPPFRDSYQSSAFLSTRVAMDDARRALMPHDASSLDGAPTPQLRIASWFTPPRIFEIGRTTAFDYSGESTDAGASTDIQQQAPGARLPCEGPLWARCGGIHPPASEGYPHLHFATLALIFTLLMLPLWLPVIAVSRAVRAWLKNFLIVQATGQRRVLRWIGLVALLVLLHVALPLAFAANWACFAGWLTQGGKPFVVLEGISVWPTEGIRILSWLLCLFMIFSGWTALSENLDEIIRHFRLGRTRRELMADQRKAELGLPWWEKLVNMFSFRFVQPEGAIRAGEVGMSGDSVDFWRRYIVQNRISARATRTTACVLIALCVSGLLWLGMRDGWYIPQRGTLVVSIHRWLHFLMIISMYFLVFFVVDATAFCVSFVRGLRMHGANWPPSTLQKFERELQIPHSYLDNWIDLEFIAWRTTCVTRLIYFPFIVLSLFLLSRSAAFDDWYMPATGIALSVLGASIALACAVALRFAAEKSRHHAMALMRDALTRVSGDPPRAAATAPAGSSAAPAAPADPQVHVPPPDPPKAAQLSLLLARMDSLHEGAFAPFWQQPLLKAVLLPFATLGGSTLLDYLALVNV